LNNRALGNNIKTIKMIRSPSQDKKRLKKCNFSREGIVLIQREVEKSYTIINSKHSNIITNDITERVRENIQRDEQEDCADSGTASNDNLEVFCQRFFSSQFRSIVE
jgi:hypothetical protein